MAEQKPEIPEANYGYPVVRYLLIATVLMFVLTGFGLFSIQELIGFFNRANQQVMTSVPSSKVSKPVEPTGSLMVYLLNEKGNLSAQTFTARALDSDYVKASVILDRLKRRPIAKNLKSPIPQSANFNSIHLLENIILVDWSIESVSAFADSIDEEMIAIFSVTNSLLGNLDGYNGVQFLVNGKPSDTLGAVDLSKPLGENLSLIQ